MPRSFHSGDRIRVSTVGDDGFPIVRYGTVGADLPADGPVVVIFDDLLGGDIVDSSEIEAIRLDAIELRLNGTDLLHDPNLRAGLADLWRAEVDLAGLVVTTLFPMERNGVVGIAEGEQFLLAEFTYNNEPWIVRGATAADSPTTVVVRADRMNRWDGFIH
jgi:hypothetical protein